MSTRFSSLITLGMLASFGAGTTVAGCGDSKTNNADGGSSGRSGAGRAGSGTHQGASGSGTAGNPGVNRGGAAGSATSSQGGGAQAGTSTQNSVGGGEFAGGGDAGAATGGKGDAGQSGAGVGGDASSFGGAGAGSCDPRELVPTLVTPTVELLVDTSSSMFGTLASPPTAWSVLYDAVMNPDNGVVHALEAKIRFGFLSYKGFQGSSETDPACAVMTAVPPALDNYTAIDAVYTAVGASYKLGSSPEWQTPTNYALGYAANLLVQDAFAGPKYILLVTDGNPNTCETVAPECGQDRAVKAAQDAYAAGVGLLVLGVGDVVSNPNSGCPSTERCGLLHLQDLANAGIGAAVAPPPHCDDPSSTDCSAKYDECNLGTLLASYTPGAPDAGTAFAVETTGPSAQSEVVAALSALLDQIAPCSFEFDTAIDAEPTRVVVDVGGTRQAYGDANGWLLDVDRRRVTLQGNACTDFRNGASFEISTPCD